MMRLYLSTHATMCVLLHFTLVFMPKIYIHATCNNNSVCGGYKMPNVIAHEYTTKERERHNMYAQSSWSCKISLSPPSVYIYRCSFATENAKMRPTGNISKNFGRVLSKLYPNDRAYCDLGLQYYVHLNCQTPTKINDQIENTKVCDTAASCAHFQTNKINEWKFPQKKGLLWKIATQLSNDLFSRNENIGWLWRIQVFRRNHKFALFLRDGVIHWLSKAAKIKQS